MELFVNNGFLVINYKDESQPVNERILLSSIRCYDVTDDNLDLRLKEIALRGVQNIQTARKWVTRIYHDKLITILPGNCITALDKCLLIVVL